MRPDIESIQARADAATAGPWEVEPEHEWEWLAEDTECDLCKRGVKLFEVVVDSDAEEATEGHRHWSPSHYIAAPREGIAGNFDYDEGGIIRHEDTVFIANARQDVPALLEYIAELEAKLAKFKEVGKENVLVTRTYEDKSFDGYCEMTTLYRKEESE